MVLDITQANKQQLVNICLWEDCSMDEKYEAARELQIRQWRDEYLPELLKLRGEGRTSPEIAQIMGVESFSIATQIKKYGLFRRKLINQKIGGLQLDKF